MVYITAVHMSSGGTRHEHIESVRWTNPDDNKPGENTTAAMVDWIDNKKGIAKVKSGTTEVNVRTVEATPKYLRTYADGVPTNNLLELPRF